MKLQNGLWIVGCVALFAALSPGEAAPSGRSAKMAARLKKAPAPSYLSHYLPDDRYKIAGGVWKYVSTDLDRYYHVPSSPNMLRQPASRVIGFASARDAEEAGYLPDPTDGTAGRVVAARSGALGAVGGSASGGGASSRASSSASGSARSGRSASSSGRVRLADGVSSLVLPRGWKRTAPTRTSQGGSTVYVDTFISPQRERVKMTRTQLPQGFNLNVEQFLKPEVFNRLSQGNLRGNLGALESASGTVNSQFSSAKNAASNLFEGSRSYSIRFGGLSGVAVKLRGGRAQTSKFGAVPGLTYLAGRGTTLFSVEDYSRSGKAALPLLRTFRTR